MNIFQEPPRTQYDLNFTLFGIPVRVHLLFWLMALIFGSASGDFLFIVIWMLVVFVSILIHELGHALAMEFFRQPAHIVLYLGGGLAIPDSVRWGTGWADVSHERRQQIMWIFAGPLAGFLLAAFVMLIVTASGGTIGWNFFLGIIPIPFAILQTTNIVINILVSTLLWVNVFWGVINLMPVFPLDGGQISRHMFVEYDVIDGLRNSLWLSVIAGGVVAFVGLFVLRSMFLGLMFGFMAYQSYQALQGYS